MASKISTLYPKILRFLLQHPWGNVVFSLLVHCFILGIFALSFRAPSDLPVSFQNPQNSSYLSAELFAHMPRQGSPEGSTAVQAQNPANTAQIQPQAPAQTDQASSILVPSNQASNNPPSEISSEDNTPQDNIGSIENKSHRAGNTAAAANAAEKSALQAGKGVRSTTESATPTQIASQTAGSNNNPTSAIPQNAAEAKAQAEQLLLGNSNTSDGSNDSVPFGVAQGTTDGFMNSGQRSTYSRALRHINTALVENWTRPESVKIGDDLMASFEVELDAQGYVQHIELTESSGHDLFDRSAYVAIDRIDRFAVPGDAAIFEAYFQRILIHFRNPS